MSHVPRFRSVVLIGALAAATVACGSGDDDDATTTTVAETTTTTEATTTTAEETTTTAVALPTAPLTGLEVDAGTDLDRPALVVKIDNHRQARPQAGLGVADIVFELRVEGITRFAAVFHSSDAEVVGPVRSARTSDPPFVTAFGTPLFANSGGNPTVMSAVRSADLIDVGHGSAAGGEYYRESGRPGTHNLMTSTEALFGYAPEDGPPVSMPFTLAADGGTGGEAVPGVSIDYGARVQFVWDDAAGGWVRFQDGVRTVDSDDRTIAPGNVVVLDTVYGTSAADRGSPEAQTVGEGGATVLGVDGTMRTGTWTRADADAPWVITGADGGEIVLGPGRTWVEMPRAGRTTPLDATVAADLLAS
ncbi:MAG: DUF3048 domain-containing protein [Actinomycetota bacterium]|nr:DUF3048 domain-containing protein [Actinomycetota bacterium]